jgi:hypothetical protein
MTAPETLPTPPNAPVAAAGKKSRRKWPWIVGGIVALFFIIGIANSGNTSTPTAGTAPPAVPIPAQQGAASPGQPSDTQSAA